MPFFPRPIADPANSASPSEKSGKLIIVAVTVANFHSGLPKLVGYQASRRVQPSHHREDQSQPA
jgi:hypothetical protein